MRAHLEIVAIFAALALLASSPPLGAQEDERGWRARLGGTWADPDAELTLLEPDQEVVFDVDDGFGVSASIEYRFFRLFGLELGVWNAYGLKARLQVTEEQLPGPPGPDFVVTRSIDEIDVLGLEVAGNFRLFTAGHADFYLGPVVAWLSYDDLEFRVPNPGGGGPQSVRLSVDDELAYGGQVGFDFAFGGGSWLFNFEAEVLAADFEIENDETLAFDPVILSARVGYRF